MTKPRRQLIDIEQTPYYHCISRCVRCAYLCGEDHVTGKNYAHRKAWALERLALLSHVFAIDVASFAILSNHMHLVLRVDQQKAAQWDDKTVAQRWRKLYSWPPWVHKYLQGKASKAESVQARAIIQTWRERLFSISWFMRCLNEYLARRANEEDNCTGRFWEGRYKSQALLCEAAVLNCMAYVDLNPIRAGIADTPEHSDYTSVKQRIETLACGTNNKKEKNDRTKKSTHIKLMPLVRQKNDRHPNAMGYTLKDYLRLIDWVGRNVRTDNRAAMPSNTPPILQRLQLNADDFLEHVLHYEDQALYPVAMGPLDKIKSFAGHLKQKFIKGQHPQQRLFSSI